jgi:hypothetical protein
LIELPQRALINPPTFYMADAGEWIASKAPLLN